MLNMVYGIANIFTDVSTYTIPYSGALSREKLSQIGGKIGFPGENLWIARFKQSEKTFTDRHKTAEFVKVSPSKVSSYTVFNLTYV